MKFPSGDGTIGPSGRGSPRRTLGLVVMAMSIQTPVLQQPVPAAQPPPRHFGAGRVVTAVAGALLMVVSLGLLTGGLALRLVDASLRDADGYLMSSSASFESPGYAVITQSLVIDNGSTRLDLPHRWLGTVKVTAEGDTGNGVFVGLARTSDVRDYLRGVARTTTDDPWGNDPGDVFADGGSPRQAPYDEEFWDVSAHGPGLQTIEWEPRAGDWTLVVMNGEGTTPVAADVSVGATVPILDDVAIGLLIGGGALLLGAGVLLWAGLLRRS